MCNAYAPEIPTPAVAHTHRYYGRATSRDKILVICLVTYACFFKSITLYFLE